MARSIKNRAASVAVFAALVAVPVATGVATSASADTIPVATSTATSMVNTSVTPEAEAQLRANIIATAASQAGVPYVWGGSTPGVGLDCSGLVQWVYGQQGIEIPRTVATIRPVVKQINEADVKPGDLIFSGFTADGKHTHVGIVVDPVKKTFWHAPVPGDVVRLSSYAGSWYKGSTFGSTINAGSTVTDASAGTSVPLVTTPNTPVTGTSSVVVQSGSTTTTRTAVVSAPVTTYAETTRVVKAGVTLNVRTSASATSSINTRIKGGAKLTGTQMSNGWFKINSGALKGKYVSNSYLRALMVKTAVTLNTRALPSATSRVTGQVTSKTSLIGVEKNGWLKITSGPKTNNYVKASYLV